ncbi:MAG: hypothetical protein AAGH64_00145 [Planctomycetota bacterium]
MDVYLDGERLSGAGTTLDATLTAAREAVGDGRLIVEAYADGRAIPERDLAEPPASDPYASEIKLISADTARLVQGPLIQASEGVSSLDGRHASVAERIQSGEVAPALGELSEVLETWTTAKTVLELAAQLYGPRVGGDAHTVDPAIEKLTAALATVKASLETQDWAELADALEFDLDPLCDTWSDILRDAAANVGAPARG